MSDGDHDVLNMHNSVYIFIYNHYIKYLNINLHYIKYL